MNNIYKVIWSKAKNCYVVASEIAKSHTKSASGSEKMGGYGKKALLALAAASAIFCGGLVNVGATVHVNDATGVANEVYTMTEVNTELDKKADKTAVEKIENTVGGVDSGLVKKTNDNATGIEVNKTDIKTLQDTVGDDTKGLTKKINDNATAINTLTTTVSGKANVADVDNKLANKADTTAVTTLEGRVEGVEGKVTTLENTVGNDSRGLVKDVNDLRTQGTTLNNALGNKADQSALAAATDRITANEGNITALQKKTTGLSNDGKSLTGMNRVETDALKVTGEISNGAGVTTTLEKIAASMDRTDMNKTWIGKLNAKTTNITHDATGTSVDGVTFNAGAVTGVTSINGTKIGTPEGGKYISQDGSIWGNMKKVDTQVETNEKNIETNKTAITTLDTKVGKIDDRTGGITRNPEKTQTTIEDAVKVDNQGNVKDVKGLSAETITTGALTVTGASDLKDNVILGTNAANTVTVNGTANFNAAVNMDKGLNVTNGESNLKNTTVDGTLSVNKETTLNGKLTAKDEATFTKKVTMEDDLEVKGELKTDKIAMEHTGTDADGTRYNSATTITADGITHIGEVEKSGVTTKSSFTHTEKGSETYAMKGDAIDQTETRSDVTADGVNTEVKDSKGNRTNTSQTTEVINGFAIDKDGNSSTTSQTAKDINGNVTDKDGNKTDMKVTATENSIQIQDKDGKNTNLQVNTMGSSVTEIKNGDGKTTKTEQTATDITNTAEQGTIKNNAMNIENNASGNITNNAQNGTITNNAKDIVNNATGNMTNIVGGKLTTTVTDKATENFNGGLDTTVTGAENHTVTGKQTNTVGGGQINNITGGQENNILSGDQETTVSNGSIINKAEHGDISNTAKNVTNEGTESVTNKVGTNEVKVSKDGVDIKVDADKTIKESVGAVTSRTMTDGNIIDQAGDMTVTTDKTTGTTFGNGTPKDITVINGGTIGTNKVNANETNTKKLTAGAAAGADGGRLTVDANDGVKGSYKYGDYTSRSYILANTLQSGVDNGKDITDNGFVGSRTDHYMDGDKAKLNETVKDADGSNVTKKTSTKTYTEIKDTNGNTLSVNQKADGNNYKLEDQDGNTNHVTNSATQSKQTLKDKDGNTLTTNQTATKNNFDLKSADGSKENHTTNTVDESRVAIKGENGKAELSTTDEGTTFKHSAAKEAFTEGGATNTTIKGNTITTGKVTMDYADVMKDLGVYGNTTLGEAGKDTTLTVNSKATFNEIATFENGAEVKNGLTVSSGGLNVTGESTFNDKVNMKNGLDVTGGVASDSFTVKGTDIKIDSSGINAGGTVISNVADGSISEGSKDAVNGGQLYQVKNDLEGKVNKVGANAAAMANLHPMEFDPDSKWNIAAAIGNYGSETAAALGAFYRPNDDVMVNLSTAFGTGENMVGGGVSVRLGKGGNKLSREESNALKDQVNDLTARMDALLSVLNPNMSKDFPDVPENHWAYEAVSRLAGNDIVQGYPDGEFHGERTMTRYEMAEIIYNALSRGAEAEKELVEEFKPELQAMAASEKATAERAEG